MQEAVGSSPIQPTTLKTLEFQRFQGFLLVLFFDRFYVILLPIVTDYSQKCGTMWHTNMGDNSKYLQIGIQTIHCLEYTLHILMRVNSARGCRRGVSKHRCGNSDVYPSFLQHRCVVVPETVGNKIICNLRVNDCATESLASHFDVHLMQDMIPRTLHCRLGHWLAVLGVKQKIVVFQFRKRQHIRDGHIAV